MADMRFTILVLCQMGTMRRHGLGRCYLLPERLDLHLLQRLLLPVPLNSTLFTGRSNPLIQWTEPGVYESERGTARGHVGLDKIASCVHGKFWWIVLRL
jgi:hypothetical protein